MLIDWVREVSIIIEPEAVLIQKDDIHGTLILRNRICI